MNERLKFQVPSSKSKCKKFHTRNISNMKRWQASEVVAISINLETWNLKLFFFKLLFPHKTLRSPAVNRVDRYLHGEP